MQNARFSRRRCIFLRLKQRMQVDAPAAHREEGMHKEACCGLHGVEGCLTRARVLPSPSRSTPASDCLLENPWVSLLPSLSPTLSPSGRQRRGVVRAAQRSCAERWRVERRGGEGDGGRMNGKGSEMKVGTSNASNDVHGGPWDTYVHGHL